ncbi:TetR family transcriptional regulator [Actinoplanes sp. NPDC051851]|uniref:TetR/AcrR family transcriptional regulator n=1 Tax=Actinoplanes sp. NPDC051851 TaxID=3154753 RepID=UPI003446EB85
MTPAERLTRDAVAERALRLGDQEGVEAITIRRLAKELGVTPMALYWHFKNKEELLLGVVDHALADVRVDRGAGDPWQEQLRMIIEAALDVMRSHPCLPDLLHAADKTKGESFTRATNDTLTLLADAGFGLDEGYWVATYLLNGVIGLVGAQPESPAHLTIDQAAEWRRQKRLALECLPADRFPMMIEFARTYEREPDVERYYDFGMDLLMSAVEAMAARAKARG